MKRCLILSDGPVPAPEHDVVEGGGLRSWGLARGIIANSDGVGVTVAYNESHKKGTFTDKYQGVNIATWNMDTVADMVQQYDTVIVSYCMGDLTIRVVDGMRPDQQLVLDCYVPIYIEASARDSNDLEREYTDFHNEVGRFAHALRRGDLFLCASEQQKRYYQGVLSALGRVNPITYHDDLILVVPYGIYREAAKATEKPITKLIGKEAAKTHKKILWFGGIYPWFDLRDLVSAVIEINKTLPAKLIIVGAKNPFNTHPDFVRKYDELLDFIQESGASDTVVLHGWADFNKRADWYLDSDVVVVINKNGPENELAWRTRLVDFTWANLPIMTNGGDPLGERLIAADAAERFVSLLPVDMARGLEELLNSPQRLDVIKGNLAKIRTELYWDTVTKSLTEIITKGTRATDNATMGTYQIIHPGTSSRSRVKSLIIKLRRLPQYAHRHGVRNTYVALKTLMVRRIKRYMPAGLRGGPHVVVVSHQLDMSGGPFVIMDFVKDLKALYPGMPIEFYTFNPVHTKNITRLNKLGIRPKILVDRNAVIDFRKGDVVVLNTTAHSVPLKDVVFRGLDSGHIAKLFWYAHEDEPEFIFNKSETNRIIELMHKDRLEMLVPAERIYEAYVKHFGSDRHIHIQSYRLVTEQKYHRVLSATDFDQKISFLLPGTVGDGRKGQLPLFYAFAEFYKDYYLKNPSQYRDFELVYVGLIDDFLSRQILRHAKAALDGHFRSHGRVTKEEHLDIVMHSNFTVCYSLREALPLFVFEGMTAGHPVLRNDCSGMKEQLVDGVNGYFLDSMDINQVVDTIERTLNRQATTSDNLAKMSAQSYELAKKQEQNSYKPMAEMVQEALRSESK